MFINQRMKFILNTLILSIFVLSSNIVSAQNVTQSNEAEILAKILKDYNSNYLQNDNLTEVIVNTYIRRIVNFDTVKMQFTCQLTFRMQWNDQRLKYENNSIPYLILKNEDSIFVPDLFFSNAVSESDFNLIKPNVLIRIYPDGKILYSKRIQLVLACPLDLKYFPFDEQECRISMASYAFTTDKLMFYWKENNPVQSFPIYVPSFSLRELKTGNSTGKTETGEYSAIYVSLLFHRQLGYYLNTIFLPSLTLVILGFSSFFFSPKDQIIKIMICLISLFLLSLGTKDVNNLTPAVGYTTALDVWMGACWTFVFVALAESVITYKMYNDRNLKFEKVDSIAFGLSGFFLIIFIIFYSNTYLFRMIDE